MMGLNVLVQFAVWATLACQVMGVSFSYATNPFTHNYTEHGPYSSVSVSHSSSVFHPPTQKRVYDSFSSHEDFPILGNEVNYGSRPSFHQGGGGNFHQSPQYNSVLGSYLGSLPYFNPALKPQPQPTCPPKINGPCPHSRYRTIDGSCNNLRNPSIGTANTNYNRLLPATYADGDHLPAASVTGQQLPGARLVSIVMFPEKPIPDPVWTLSSMQWGQIITHDMSMAMGTTQTKPYANQCCSPDGRLVIPHEHAPAHCFPIEIPADDPFFSKFNQMCMNFMRSTTDVELGCGRTHGKAQEQIVAVTQWMDASLVYGSTPQVAASLREGHGGRLRVEVRHGRQWPPPADNKTRTCANQDDDEPCYKFGDVRANQNPQLTVLQIILLREHNRIADALSHINPHWDDETVFQEARRILIAEYQHINYAEWLPIFIGTKNMMKYGLLYKTDGYVNDYREDVEPNVLNEHATAAFRYFHSAIQGHLELITEHRRIDGALRLSDYLNKPGVIEEGDNMDKLTRGLSTQSEEEVDPFLTSEITDYLFRNGMPFGRDLRAIDIQRGRDHGLASYNSMRHFCGLPKARKFEDFTDHISPENVEKLSLLYAHPDDVDLVVGGSLEAHVKDTLTGPTFLCVMLEQFYRTRVSDRFFYESGDHDVAFTPEQLKEIRKSTLSRLLCDNGDHIEYMQPEGFRVIGEKNQLVPCSDARAIPTIDLSLWKDHSAGHTGFGGPTGFSDYDFDYFGKK